MAARKLREPKWKTVLEREPEYLTAIGTVAVETVNLETMLAELLGIILRIHPDTGDAIYWAPQALGARLAILQGIIDEEMIMYPSYQAKAAALITKTRKLGNRRNNVLHHVWGLNRADNKVILGQPPSSRYPERHVPRKEVERLVYDIRIAATDVIDFIDALAADAEYVSSHDRPSRLEAMHLAAKAQEGHSKPLPQL